MYGSGRAGIRRSYRQFDSSITKQKITPGTARRIVKYARPYRVKLSIFMITTVIDSLIIVVNPLLLRAIIDKGILHHDEKIVIILAGVVAAVALCDAVLTFVIQWYSARIGQGLVADLRNDVFKHVLKQGIGFFSRTQTGSLVSRLNTDVVGAQQAVTSTLSGVVSNAVKIIVILLTMLYLSWPITLIAIVLIPIFIIPAKLIGRKMQRLTRESMQIDALLGSHMTERFNVAGALLVKLYGRPKEESEIFGASVARARDVGIAAAVVSQSFVVGLTLIAYLATAAVYGLGGTLVINGAILLGTLVALTTLLTRLYTPIGQLSNVQVTVMTALVSFDRVFEVLDFTPMILENPGSAPLLAARNGDAASLETVGAPAVEFDHVSFRYPSANKACIPSLQTVVSPDLEQDGDADVLFEVNFAAEPGQMTALVGPSGAGKSTITHLLARQYDPNSGAVRIGGQDLREVTLASLYGKVGVVPQEPHFFHDTIRANLVYADPDVREQDLIEACKAAQIWNVVSSLPSGLDTVVGDRGYRMSGGEKQRLALARLVLKAPAVVILDEATAHLDSESEAAVQRALKTVLAGRTSLVIAHRLATVREADQILVLDGGRITERGCHEDLLLAGGMYASLYRTQFAPL
jgi:ATP-binding cassette subfamily B protein